MGKKRNDKYDKAYSEYLAGKSLAGVAKALGVTRQGVYKAFKLRGFALRGPSFQPFIYYKGKKFSLRNHGYYELTTPPRTLMHRFVWEDVTGEKIPFKHDIHHIDNNKANNSFENLECLPKSEHTRKYSPHNNQYTKGRKKCK